MIRQCPLLCDHEASLRVSGSRQTWPALRPLFSRTPSSLIHRPRRRPSPIPGWALCEFQLTRPPFGFVLTIGVFSDSRFLGCLCHWRGLIPEGGFLPRGSPRVSSELEPGFGIACFGRDSNPMVFGPQTCADSCASGAATPPDNSDQVMVML